MRKRASVVRAALDRRFGVHDRHQFELKLEYLPPTDEPKSRYVVEAYLCVPGSLNVSRDTVSLDDHYSDIHNYVRLKTPELSWTELNALPDSPLSRVAAELEGVARGGDATRFVYECKMFASVFRAQLRDLCERTERHVGEQADVRAVVAVETEAEAAVTGSASAMRAFRALKPRATAAEVPERARTAYRLADEYTSVSVEQMVRRVIVALARRPPTTPDAATAADALKQRLLEVILAEERYRRGEGYPTIIDPRSDNEPYIYRAGLLKKYCQSALFLQIRRQLARKTWQEILFAVAAGIAMAFATVVAFWAQARYSRVGLQLFAILVVAYMFKDRLKEATRHFFSRILEKTLYDRKIVIDDPAGGQLGVFREKIGYLPPELVPEDVRAIRRRDVDPSARLAEEELVETIIHYKKELVLSSSRLLGRRGGGGLTDVVRFQIVRLLRDMDEPDQEIEYIDLNTRNMEPVRAAKTYHVDVVFRFTARAGQAPQTSLMRLILDRNGIKRIERIET